jgi:hypothetical protein
MTPKDKSPTVASRECRDRARLHRPRKCPLCGVWLHTWTERALHLAAEHSWVPKRPRDDDLPPAA